MHNHPLQPVATEKDIMALAKLWTEETKHIFTSEKDPFWDNAIRLLYCSLIAYVRQVLPQEKDIAASVLSMLYRSVSYLPDDFTAIPGVITELQEIDGHKIIKRFAYKKGAFFLCEKNSENPNFIWKQFAKLRDQYPHSYAVNMYDIYCSCLNNSSRADDSLRIDATQRLDKLQEMEKT